MAISVVREQALGLGSIDLNLVPTTYILCVKLLNFSMPQFPHLSDGYNNGTFPSIVVSINILIHEK